MITSNPTFYSTPEPIDPTNYPLFNRNTASRFFEESASKENDISTLTKLKVERLESDSPIQKEPIDTSYFPLFNRNKARLFDEESASKEDDIIIDDTELNKRTYELESIKSNFSEIEDPSIQNEQTNKEDTKLFQNNLKQNLFSTLENNYEKAKSKYNLDLHSLSASSKEIIPLFMSKTGNPSLNSKEIQTKENVCFESAELFLRSSIPLINEYLLQRKPKLETEKKCTEIAKEAQILLQEMSTIFETVKQREIAISNEIRTPLICSLKTSENLNSINRTQALLFTLVALVELEKNKVLNKVLPKKFPKPPSTLVVRSLIDSISSDTKSSGALLLKRVTKLFTQLETLNLRTALKFSFFNTLIDPTLKESTELFTSQTSLYNLAKRHLKTSEERSPFIFKSKKIKFIEAAESLLSACEGLMNYYSENSINITEEAIPLAEDMCTTISQRAQELMTTLNQLLNIFIKDRQSFIKKINCFSYSSRETDEIINELNQKKAEIIARVASIKLKEIENLYTMYLKKTSQTERTYSPKFGIRSALINTELKNILSVDKETVSGTQLVKRAKKSFADVTTAETELIAQIRRLAPRAKNNKVALT